MELKKSARPEEQLLSAVVVLAIEDACLSPIKKSSKKYVMNQYAYSAHRFLFEHSDAYLELINIDPKSFRERLVEQMNDRTHNRPFDITDRLNLVAERKKRMFRVNQKLYTEKSITEMPTEEDEDDDNDI
jgi:hypothetical protein